MSYDKSWKWIWGRRNFKKCLSVHPLIAYQQNVLITEVPILEICVCVCENVLLSILYFYFLNFTLFFTFWHIILKINVPASEMLWFWLLLSTASASWDITNIWRIWIITWRVGERTFLLQVDGGVSLCSISPKWRSSCFSERLCGHCF